MTIQDWGAVRDIIGAIAVIVTLVYLAAQIWLNTNQLRNEGHKGITDSYNEIIAQLLTDNDLFKIVVRGCQEWNSISAFGQSRFHLFCHQHLMHLRMSNQLRRKGAIDDDVYESVERLHINVLANPGARIWWKMVGESLVEKPLVDMINDKLDSVQGTDSATTEAWAFYDPKNWVGDK